jgi:hypothetical protein
MAEAKPRSRSRINDVALFVALIFFWVVVMAVFAGPITSLIVAAA